MRTSAAAARCDGREGGAHRGGRRGDGVEHHPGLPPKLVRLRAVYVDHLAELRERRAQRLSQLCSFGTVGRRGEGTR